MSQQHQIIVKKRQRHSKEEIASKIKRLPSCLSNKNNNNNTAVAIKTKTKNDLLPLLKGGWRVLYVLQRCRDLFDYFTYTPTNNKNDTNTTMTIPKTKPKKRQSMTLTFKKKID